MATDYIVIPGQADVSPQDVRVWNDDGAGQGQRQMGNVVGTLLTSAARTATVLGASLKNPNHRGIALFLDVTAISGTTPTAQIRLNMLDPVTGKAFVINLFAAVTAVGSYAYLVYPTAVAGSWTASLNAALPTQFSVDLVIGGTTPSVTCTMGYALIL